jgi:surface polysaccharide O-acyltransferase-like enzyme
LTRYGLEQSEIFVVFNQIFVLYRMPILVFLSGILLASSFRKGAKQFVSGKLRNIAWPWILWSAIYIAIFYDVETIGRTEILLGGSYLWYLFFILIYYMVALLLMRVPPLIIAAVALTLSITAPDGGKFTERLCYLAAFFFLGSWVGARWNEWIDVIRSRWVLALMPIVVGFSAASVASSVQYGPGTLKYGPDNWIAALSFIVLASAAAYALQGRSFVKAFAFIGRNSLIYYVAHYPLIYLAIGGLLASGLRSSFAISVMAFATALAAATVLCLCAERSRIVRILFAAPGLPAWVMAQYRRRPRRLIDAPQYRAELPPRG